MQSCKKFMHHKECLGEKIFHEIWKCKNDS